MNKVFAQNQRNEILATPAGRFPMQGESRDHPMKHRRLK